MGEVGHAKRRTAAQSGRKSRWKNDGASLHCFVFGCELLLLLLLAIILYVHIYIRGSTEVLAWCKVFQVVCGEISTSRLTRRCVVPPPCYLSSRHVFAVFTQLSCRVSVCALCADPCEELLERIAVQQYPCFGDCQKNPFSRRYLSKTCVCYDT